MYYSRENVCGLNQCVGLRVLHQHYTKTCQPHRKDKSNGYCGGLFQNHRRGCIFVHSVCNGNAPPEGRGVVERGRGLVDVGGAADEARSRAWGQHDRQDERAQTEGGVHWWGVLTCLIWVEGKIYYHA